MIGIGGPHGTRDRLQKYNRNRTSVTPLDEGGDRVDLRAALWHVDGIGRTVVSSPAGLRVIIPSISNRWLDAILMGAFALRLLVFLVIEHEGSQYLPNGRIIPVFTE